MHDVHEDGWEGWEEVRFVTSVKGGKVCLKSGRALVRCVVKGEVRKTSTAVEVQSRL